MTWFLFELVVLTSCWHLLPRPRLVLGAALEELSAIIR